MSLAVHAHDPSERTDEIRRGGPLVPGLLVAGALIPLASAQGGYFPTAWGWAALALAWVAAIALAVRPRIVVTPLEIVFVGALAGFALWTALSLHWSADVSQTALELERTLVYVTGVLALLAIARRRSVPQLLGGLAVAIVGVCSFSLATRLFPDRLSVFDSSDKYRLSEPIGYWNGLALFAVMGVLLAAGFAARGRSIATRMLGAASLVVLVPTLYFTFGRAAWVALAAAAVVAIALDRRRLQLVTSFLVVAPAPGIAVVLAARSSALTTAGASLAAATQEGHRLAFRLVLLAVLAALAVGLLALAEARIQVPAWIRQGYAVVLVLVVCFGFGAGVARYGGPGTIARKGYDSFTAPAPKVTDLNQRLLNFSGNGRADLWRLAWDDYRNHPWGGSGAGSYERYFLAHQPDNLAFVHDAHGLYIETLAELGPVGLALLLCVLVAPLVAAVKARGHRLVPTAAGAYVAFLVHAAVDWDWELAAITLCALFCGAAILVAARTEASARAIPVAGRIGAIAAAVLAAVLAGGGLVGNSALATSNAARGSSDWGKAADYAHRASRWMPWSGDPWDALGVAQYASGDTQAARASFRKGLSIDPGSWELWADLARVSAGPTRQHALGQAAALYRRGDFEHDRTAG